MKKFIISALALSMLSLMGFSQAKIQGTITDPAPGGNKVQVYGKNNSATDLTNVLFGNINLTFSIADQGAGNPTDAQITKASLIPSLDIAPVDGNNPYIISGRAYYSYIMTSNVSITTSTWPANSNDNPIAEFTFPANTYFPGLRLDDMSPDGGPNGQMYWYVQVNGAGDITDYSTMFFGLPATPPTNNSQASPSFVPLQDFTVVPVKFLGFTASKGNNNSALLNWSVENEDVNTASYVIEKSLNGIDFSVLTTLPALNNGRNSNIYSYTQANLSSIRNTGIIYFRIKQIDRDGKFIYTEIRSVRLDSKGLVLGVYPNPIKTTANVSFDLGEAADVLIKITDASGKQVVTTQVQGFKGPNISKISMANLATGSYTLNVQAGAETKTMTIVKAQQ